MPIDNELYDRLGGSWWDEDNPLNLLHGSLTPARMDYFRTVLRHRLGGGPARLKALDIGCGAGLLAEEFARLGCEVTGVDPSGPALAAARRHAAEGGLDIHYLAGSGEELPLDDRSFDVVLCCDVLEHVADLPRVIAETARVMKPGGLYLFDTVNRTAASWLLAIKILQDWPQTRIIDAQLHSWYMFIKPRELAYLLQRSGLQPGGLAGLAPRANPLAALSALRSARRGAISYGELGRRLDFGQVRTTALSYMGYAVRGS
ncbi:bifunctional 2-polyprenyl-6-hydroxyphenol methylase/3-demethylubiquinol 3-O-methyltransferase UbiG [Arthrobacter sp. USHLN218]|uniref:bifunctional 2-polyprenyl-6-hydroxyphenol methylase/3-demethylubiquinol 3-O-methyltransferase UbiG n=1 Tax=Arthrobacter sp. USHLN218 TaxID=3081232 RepID=UPI00301A8749